MYYNQTFRQYKNKKFRDKAKLIKSKNTNTLPKFKFEYLHTLINTETSKSRNDSKSREGIEATTLKAEVIFHQGDEEFNLRYELWKSQKRESETRNEL